MEEQNFDREMPNVKWYVIGIFALRLYAENFVFVLILANFDRFML